MNLKFKNTEFVPVRNISIPDIYFNRLKTGINEIDEFINANNSGGGLLRGGVYILAAGAGSGKSTFCLTVAEALTNQGHKVAYASGEESIEQLAFTCNRLGVKNTAIAVQSDLGSLLKKMEELDVLFIDSFQSLTTSKFMTGRKKEYHCITEICHKAKTTGCTVIALCHLTKQGSYKGSTTILHAADALINISIHEEIPTVRIFSWGKNRFGPSDKSIELEMTSKGYKFTSEVPDIAKIEQKPITNNVKLTKKEKDSLLTLAGL